MNSAVSVAGARVVVTAADGKRSDLAARLVATGADVCLVPMITTERLLDGAVVRRHLEAAAGPARPVAWVVFTSETAVDLVVESAADLVGFRLAAVGEATAAALRAHGLAVELVPRRATADALATALVGAVGRSRVVVFGAGGGRDLIGPALRGAGATAQLVVLYRSVVPPGAAARFRAAITPRADVVTFSSGSAVRHVELALAGSPPPGLVAACLGPVTAAVARAAGWTDVVVAPQATAASLVATVVARLRGGHPVP